MIINFGEIIKKAIEKHNLKQKDVAEDLNISPQTLSHYINNKRLPQIDCFFDMMNLLDLNEVFIATWSYDDEQIIDFLIKTIPTLSEEQNRILLFIVRYFKKDR